MKCPCQLESAFPATNRQVQLRKGFLNLATSLNGFTHAIKAISPEASQVLLVYTLSSNADSMLFEKRMQIGT